jgi:hypothetical protein
MAEEGTPKKRAAARPKKGSEAVAEQQDTASALSRIEATLKALEAQRSAAAEARPPEAASRDGEDPSDHKSSSERKRGGVGEGGGGGGSGTKPPPARVRGAGGAARALASGGVGAVLTHGDLVYFTLPNIAGAGGLLVGDVKLGRYVSGRGKAPAVVLALA